MAGPCRRPRSAAERAGRCSSCSCSGEAMWCPRTASPRSCGGRMPRRSGSATLPRWSAGCGACSEPTRWPAGPAGTGSYHRPGSRSTWPRRTAWSGRPNRGSGPASRHWPGPPPTGPSGSWGGGPCSRTSPYAEWAEAARAEAAALLRRARRCAGQAASAVSDFEPAARVMEAAVSDDPLDEEAHRELMLAYSRRGELGRALETYERLRGVLAEELGTDPAPETRAVHLAILRQEAVPSG